MTTEDAADDVLLWPDGAWCFRIHRGIPHPRIDAHRVFRYATKEWDDIVFLGRLPSPAEEKLI
jgi:hypothetical protein